MKVLWYSDFLCPTGFGNVAEELISRLVDRFEFTVVGINYHGDPYNTQNSPYYKFRDIPVYPAASGGDPLGRGRVIELLEQGDYDILFALQDTFNLVSMDESIRRVRGAKKFKYALYFPVDAPLDRLWVTNAVETADRAVAYTEYGKREVRKHSDEKLRVLYHGVDTKTFKPVEKAKRKRLKRDLFSVSSKDFIITNVNKNQPRKDLPRTVMVWLKVKERISNAKLYLHTDVHSGNGDLINFISRQVPEELRGDVLYPRDFGPSGFPKDLLRNIYCASDVVVSTTLGEGWGLSTTEAMACKVPVVMPRHTSCQEIIGERQERGWLADCSDFTVLPEYDNSHIRPLTSVDSMASCICDVHDRPKEAAKRSRAAYSWIKKHCNWGEIANSWAKLFYNLVK